jgi:hypothetical protein
MGRLHCSWPHPDLDHAPGFDRLQNKLLFASDRSRLCLHDDFLHPEHLAAVFPKLKTYGRSNSPIQSASDTCTTAAG